MTVAARMRVVCSCAESATAELRGCERSAGKINHKDHKAHKGRHFFVIFVSFVVLGIAKSSAWNRMAHYNPLTRPMLKRLAALVFAALMAVASDPPEVDWPFYGGDQGGAKYSPLTDVNPSTVAQLRVAWEWKTGEKALAAHGNRPG